MQTFVALLRAVNVAGHGKLAMAELRALAQAAGLSDVRSYIQSGNLVVSSGGDAASVKAALEAGLEAHAGRHVGVIVRTSQDMRAVQAANPFPHGAPGKVGVLFLQEPPPPGLIETAKGRADEEIVPGAREIFIHYPSGMGRSRLRLAAMAEGTMRNMNTVAKLTQMAADP